MRFRLLTSMVFVLVSSCSHVTHVDRPSPDISYGKINYLGQRRSAIIEFTDREMIKSDYLCITGNSLNVRPPGATKNYQYSIDSVKQISFKDHFIGAGYGFFQGAVLGVLTGLIIVGDGNSEMAGLAILYPALIGSVGGTLLGGIVGNKLVFVINKRQNEE